ncbi:MAG: hypothetical protein IBX50_04055 [Marinospirillum sp.]|uniref:VapE domain-containing protein n=1 Tax=Marinospirillum sp. TaxID=2183934 RepID=UPI001A09595C|nr:VapE domain-containing protein [Marinospirillum sp.]MBE0505879.1 hypothetical protein [Marinospirillum sp.]
MSRPSKFAHWVAQQSWRDPGAMIERFRVEMSFAAESVGAQAPEQIEFDGKRHYLLSATGQNDQKQYYVASLEKHTDGTLWPEVTFGSFRASVNNQYWLPRNTAWQEFEVARRSGSLSEDSDNLRRYKDAIAEQVKRAEELKRQRDALAAEAAEAARSAVLNALSNACRPFMPGESHPYLDAKGLTPDNSMRIATADIHGRLYSYRYAEWRDRALIVRAGDLVIPMCEAVPDGKIWSIQRIGQDGTKLFPAGSRKKGLYAKIEGKNDLFGVCEGWATGKTSATLTGMTVLVAFDCGNLDCIVNFARGMARGKPVILLADNDLATLRKRGKNPGIEAAESIKLAQQVPYITPEITPDMEEACSDWDDYRQQFGKTHAAQVMRNEISRALRVWAGYPANNPDMVPVERLVNAAVQQPANQLSDQSGQGTGSAPQDEDYGDVAVMQEQTAKPIKPSGKPVHWGSMRWDDTLPVFNFPHRNDKETAPLDTRENLQLMLESYGVECRYNRISKDNELVIPGRDFSRDNKTNAAISEIRSLASRCKLPVGSIDRYIISIADRNAYNPISNWIKSRRWDGHDRIQAILDTLRTPATFNEDLKNILLVKWMLSCVAAVMTPDDHQFFSKGVLVLQGLQNAGKTSWFRSLVAPEVAGYIKDGMHLDPANKDSILTAVSHWIVELGELDATFRKADIAKLKAFITQSEDRLRRPYDPRDSILPRRTLFFASVNDKSFLVDDTGNSRWWTIEVESINYNHSLDMQQVWAQIYETMYLNEAPHWLLPDEEAMLNASNEHYEQIDPIEERILAYFEFDVTYSIHGKRQYHYQANQEIMATDILIKIGYDRPDQRQRTKVGKILSGMGLAPRRSSRGSVYYMPDQRPRLNA